MFDTLTKQPRIRKTLSHMIESRQISHAYLLVGSDRSSREEIALTFASAIRCTADTALRPCGQCPNCRALRSGHLSDFIHIAAEEGSNSIKIKQIRNLITMIARQTFDDHMRICLISDAETMTTEAQNALLKSLEEPFPGNVFILTAQTLEKILPTIRSRCQVLTLDHSTAIMDIDENSMETEACSVLFEILKGNPMPLFAFSEQMGKDKNKSATVINHFIRQFEKIFQIEKSGILPHQTDPITKQFLPLLQEGQSEKILEILFLFSERLQYNVNCRLQWERTLLKIYETIPSLRSTQS